MDAASRKINPAINFINFFFCRFPETAGRNNENGGLIRLAAVIHLINIIKRESINKLANLPINSLIQSSIPPPKPLA